MYQEDKQARPRLHETVYSQFLDKDELFELKQSLAKYRLKEDIFYTLKSYKKEKEKEVQFEFFTLNSSNFDM